MIRAALRTFALPLVLGAVIMVAVVASYWGLEALLAHAADYERGLWEGAALATIINNGHAIASRMLRRVNSKTKESV